MNSNREKMTLWIWLSVFALVLLLAGFEFLRNGSSAIAIILAIFSILVAAKLSHLFQRSHKKLAQVIEAMANDDPTLGLNQTTPLAKKLAQVSEQISQNRKKSESQAQFLQSLLLHLDQAIIVVNGEGKIIHKNPASEKLLGTSVSSLEVLGELGELIASTYVNSRATVSWQLGDSSDTLSVHISCCEIDSEFLKLVSIQSIHLALMTKEQQAYQRLTKVLTHEVANSITPMTSLAQTAQSLVPDPSAFDDAEDRQDLFEALNAIASRSSHLGMFIKSFHQIANLPSPNLQKVELSELVQQVLVLFKGQAQEQNIQLTFTNEANCLLTADPAQIEQVLINLVKNAFEAVNNSEVKEVTLRLRLTSDKSAEQQLILDIEDTGPGIAEHVVEQVFIPFFTTKKQGSGIGLSLARQIMIQHGGDLSYIYKDHKGACFRLTFNS